MTPDELMPHVYEELRRLAAGQLARERPEHTLDATALVHEAYLRLGGDQSFTSKSHFMRAAATSMRRILVDHARARLTHKRGGQWHRLPEQDTQSPQADAALLELDEALTKLAREDALAAQVVELHHFAGLPHEQVAATLAITVYEARQRWTYARAWLKAEIQPI